MSWLLKIEKSEIFCDKICFKIALKFTWLNINILCIFWKQDNLTKWSYLVNVMNILRSQCRLWVLICCKTNLKKKFIFWNNICVFYKICIICRKKCFYMENVFILKKFFTEKNFFYREKYIWKCKNYISYLRNVFLYKKCLCYKQNINLS